MTNKLQQYFPMIRTREEVLNEIESKSRLKNLFYEWTEENQNEFLDFCTGVKGIKIMYDFMIKEILNPENTPERVNELLTLLLGQRVRIVDVLPNDGTRLADESTLLITDMVVQLEDGSIANLEIQKIGYYFPGERSACYSAATGSSFRTHGDTQKPVSDFLSSDTGFPLSHNNSLYYIFSFLILILCILSHKLLMLQIFFNMLSSLVYDRTHMIVCQ